MNKKSFNKNSQSGFTLIEMIVSLAIFTVVALIALGALIKVMDANRKSISLKTAINNLNFAVESMSREMRVGSKYQLVVRSDVENDTISHGYSPDNGSKSNATDEWVVYFNSSKSCFDTTKGNVIYAYRYVIVGGKGKLQKAQEDGNCVSGITGTDFLDLTSPSVDISKSIISVDNTNQPFISFWFYGKTGVRIKDQTDFSLQSSVSQRIK